MSSSSSVGSKSQAHYNSLLDKLDRNFLSQLGEKALNGQGAKVQVNRESLQKLVREGKVRVFNSPSLLKRRERAKDSNKRFTHLQMPLLLGFLACATLASCYFMDKRYKTAALYVLGGLGMLLGTYRLGRGEEAQRLAQKTSLYNEKYKYFIRPPRKGETAPTFYINATWNFAVGQDKANVKAAKVLSLLGTELSDWQAESPAIEKKDEPKQSSLLTISGSKDTKEDDGDEPSSSSSQAGKIVAVNFSLSDSDNDD